MLKLEIPGTELYNAKTNEFINTKPKILILEHSLVSVSKWESIWCKPFLTKTPKTIEETISYIKCMNISQNIEDIVFQCLTEKDITKINEYIDAPMTATTINNAHSKPNHEIITSEIIYYWMITYNIPVEFQKWHLNRLLTLIQVCSAKNNPQKMSKSEVLKQHRAINQARRSKRAKG